MPSYFDIHAANYDETFSNTPIGLLQRNKVKQSLKKFLVGSRPLRILEINCGTGVDAFWLASQANEVIATDASHEMIKICKSKLDAFNKGADNGSQNPVSLPDFVVCDFRDLRNKFENLSFDLIFSDFGGLNCIGPDELKELSKDLYRLLRPDGQLVTVVMGRKCLWERMYFLLKGKNSIANRRKSIHPIEANMDNDIQSTWYYSPREFFSLFETEFLPVFQKPIGLFLPPSYLSLFFSNKPLLLKSLSAFENLFAHPSFADYADHFLLAMRKKPHPLPIFA